MDQKVRSYEEFEKYFKDFEYILQVCVLQFQHNIYKATFIYLLL